MMQQHPQNRAAVAVLLAGRTVGKRIRTMTNNNPRRDGITAGANGGNDEQKNITSSSPIFQQPAGACVKQLAGAAISKSSVAWAAPAVNSYEEINGREAQTTTLADNDRSIEIGTVDEADEYSIDQSHLDGGADDDLQKVFAGRPSEDYYWRTHPDKGNEWKLAWTIEFEGETYLVHPKIAEVKRASERKIRPLLLVRCVNVKGREQIWPIKLDRPGKKRNDCNASALMVAERMLEDWLMLVYDDDTKTYFGRRPVPPITDAPKWTQRTFQQLRDLAFPEDRRIDTLEHEVWRKLASGR
jgi:hypothetical protein